MFTSAYKDLLVVEEAAVVGWNPKPAQVVRVIER